ncbi:MAG: DUF2007 domain-containing protein [Planctomycetota bacterium]
MARVTEIARADTAFEAQRLVSLLGEVGIEAEVDGVHIGTMFGSPPLFGIRVLVAEADAERAAAALAELAPAPHDEDEVAADGDVGDTAEDDVEEDADGAVVGEVADPAGARAEDAGSGSSASAAADPAVEAGDGNAATRDEAGAVLEPWPAAKAERWTRQLYNMAIGALLLLVVYAPVGLVLLVYVAVQCVDPPYGVLDAPLARRRLRWARVAAGVGAALVVAAGLVYGWGLRIGS